MAAKAPAPRPRSSGSRKAHAGSQALILADPAETTHFTRRALPWLAASTFHAVLMAVSVMVIVHYQVPVPTSPVEVVLDAGYSELSGGPQPGNLAGSSLSSSSRLAIPAPSRTGIRVPRPVATAGSRPRMQPISTPRDRDIGSMPQPSAQDVLGDLPSARQPDSHGQMGWNEGTERRIIVRRDPQFPRTLAAAGVEVECSARITVSPAGAVTRVEITRSSGYTVIDAGVEAALREFLFSPAEGRNDAVGTITFRFRLEKRD
jgi:TonB family protein